MLGCEIVTMSKEMQIENNYWFSRSLLELGKEGWIVKKSGFAVSLFFKRQFWLWREEPPEQDYLVLSPENPLEMEFKSVAKLFNNNFKRYLASNLPVQ